MASGTFPFPLSNVQRQPQERVAIRIPSVRAVIAVFVALLILFSWLRLILSLEIALTGREIQINSRELDSITRTNNDLQRRISELESPAVLAKKAAEMGFSDSSPVYVTVSDSLPVIVGEQELDDGRSTEVASARPAISFPGLTPLDIRAGDLNALFEAEATR